MRKSQKEELFSAAFRLFILHGYDGVSFSDIEKATVITRAIERREVQSGIDVDLLAQTFSTLFYGRAYRDSLTKVLDADLLKCQMLQLYELIAVK